jgi:hypothetical protein
MKSSILQIALLFPLALSWHSARAGVGAEMPWTTYEAEEMKTTGTVLGPKYGPFLVEMESSRQKCVKLTAAGEYVEFAVQSPANAMVIRYSLPDAPDGGGIDSTLSLYQNGKLVKKLPITSRYSWLYGNYPFSNQPREGKPRNFYDECRVQDLALVKGDVVRLEKSDPSAPYCILDLVDLEQAPAPLAAPANSLSAAEFGASGTGASDDTEALRKCIAAASKQGKTVWVPPGVYKVTGDLILPEGLALQGAGMWHTTFVGDPELYGHADRRVRFGVNANHIRLSDFAIVGKLNYRNDNEANDGVVGAHSQDSKVSRIWVEHTKVGMWFYNCGNLVVEGCRFRDTLADGINFCVGMHGSAVQNCTTRGTGDDCFAIWPAPSDQGFNENEPRPGSNVFRHCTGQLPFLANGGAVYGGAANRIEDCLFTDISPGCGILLSTTFPTSDEKSKIDNNFSGTTAVRNCELVRCGGFDHGWAWRAALQLCLDRRSISGVSVTDVKIRDSLSDAISIVAPGAKNGQGMLSNTRLDNVTVQNFGLGAASRHGLWVREDASGSLTISHSQITDIQNSSTNFTIIRK